MDKIRIKIGAKSSLLAALGGLLGALTTIGIMSALRVEKAPSESTIQEVITEVESTLELADETVTAVVENANGVLEAVNLPTVLEVDGGEIVDLENYARGEYFDVSTPNIFAEQTMGKCVVEGNYYGAQCVSLARTFWLNYTGRAFSTCGTGAAKGAFKCTTENAGEEFEIVTDKNSLQAGDWIIFDGGLYGHVGMAMGPANNGYIALLGENQGGKACDEGGSATNVINISLKNFIGAYRPKIYIPPEPEVKVTPDTGEGVL